MDKVISYQQRLSIETYPPICTGVVLDDLGTKDDFTKIQAHIAKIGKLPADLSDDTKYPLLPDGITREMSGQEVSYENRRKAAFDLAKHWLTDDLFQRSIAALTSCINDDDRKFDKVLIVYPVPLQDSASRNLLVPAMAAILLQKLHSSEEKICDIPVLFDIQDNAMGGKKPLHISIKRTRTAAKSNVDAVQAMVGTKLANQIVVDGEVAPALYWIIDDNLTLGGTLKSYIDYITAKGGTVGAATMLTQRSKGTEILSPTKEALDFLSQTVRDLDQDHYTDNTLRLLDLMRNLGVEINLESTKDTTATNQEILLLAGYFSDPNQTNHSVMLQAALKSIGATAECSGHSYGVRLANMPAGSIQGLEKMLCDALGVRQLQTSIQEIRR